MNVLAHFPHIWAKFLPITYRCDGCGTHIQPLNARFNCLVCPDYDSCQRCQTASRFAVPHDALHPVRIVYAPAAPAPARRGPPPGLPPPLPSSACPTPTPASDAVIPPQDITPDKHPTPASKPTEQQTPALPSASYEQTAQYQQAYRDSAAYTASSAAVKSGVAWEEKMRPNMQRGWTVDRGGRHYEGSVT